MGELGGGRGGVAAAAVGGEKRAAGLPDGGEGEGRWGKT